MGSVMGGDLGISECSGSGLSDGGRSRSVQPVGSVMGGDLGMSSVQAVDSVMGEISECSASGLSDGGRSRSVSQWAQWAQ